MPHVPPGAAPRRGTTLITLCIAVLVAQIDTSVVNLAVRPIGEHFAASVGALQWVVDSYNLVYAALLLTGGLAADLYGRRKAFLAGALIFTAASILCGLAPSVEILVGGRALTGIGAALLLPASLSIIRVVWTEPTDRARVLGIWAACNGLAFVIGPTLGGVLINAFDWRSIFFVVVPFGLAALALGLRSIPESSDPGGRHFDGLAQILGAVALGGLAVSAIEFQGAPAAAAIALLLAVTAFLLFLKVEHRKGPSALVPLDLFETRAFRGAMITTACMTFGMYGVLFLLPMTWQSSGRLGTAGAGAALIPMALAFVSISPFSGRLVKRFGTRAITSSGAAMIGTGLLVIGLGAGASVLLPAEAGLLLTGVGMGFVTGPLMGVAVGVVAAARSGTAAALINAARLVGATMGVAVLGSVFTLTGSGAAGLRAAMCAGGLVQLYGAATAWRALCPNATSIA